MYADIKDFGSWRDIGFFFSRRTRRITFRLQYFNQLPLLALLFTQKFIPTRLINQLSSHSRYAVTFLADRQPCGIPWKHTQNPPKFYPIHRHHTRNKTWKSILGFQGLFDTFSMPVRRKLISELLQRRRVFLTLSPSATEEVLIGLEVTLRVERWLREEAGDEGTALYSFKVKLGRAIWNLGINFISRGPLKLHT